jgi:sugar lactone lactonase YvrE
MLKRRNFLGFAVAGAAGAATISQRALAQFMPANDPDASLTAQRSGTNSCLPDWSKLPTSTAPKHEVLYKTPHGQPNGLALTRNPGEMWVVDQGNEHYVSLIKIEDGSLIREIKADTVGPSGAVIDEQDDNKMWITSTHNNLIVACNATTGETIAKMTTPGSGKIYHKFGDPPERASKQPRAYPRPTNVAGGARRGAGGLTPVRMEFGHLPMDSEDDVNGRTGAHGMLYPGGETLLYVCPPSRAIFTIKKSNWEVQSVFPTPGDRPHGVTWANAGKTAFWNGDSNLNAFYRYDYPSGRITHKVQLQDDPYTVLHGAKLILNGPGAGYLYFCDDTGWMCRVKWNYT